MELQIQPVKKMSGVNPCDHKFVHLRAVTEKIHGMWHNTYKLTDYYFCEKCLKERTQTKFEDAERAPNWWLGAFKRHET